MFSRNSTSCQSACRCSQLPSAAKNSKASIGAGKTSSLVTRLVLGVCLIGSLAGCAFFDEPVRDLGDITPGAPPQTTDSSLPSAPSSAGGTNSTARQPLQPVNADRTTDAGTNRVAPPNLPGSGSYLTVASLIDVPEDATNLAFVHFTQTGNNRDSARELAVCQATMEVLPMVPVNNIPAGADTVLIWPVTNSDSGNSCLEIIANYEALDISIATAERVNESSKGPFLLTRNAGASKRLIYDLSYIGKSRLPGAIDEWSTLLGSDPANWPEYRSAR